MALDISNKINDATDIITLQNKDIRNRIISTENEIKHHMNDAEMCILEAIEGLGESISNIDGSGGNCNCDLSNLDAVLKKDILTEVTIGGIEKGTTLVEGMTFTEFVERLFTLINYGSIENPTCNGTVSINAPSITVYKSENGSWVPIESGTTIKENTLVKVSVTDIPESVFKDVWAGIKKEGDKPGDVLAYGWLRSVNNGEVESGNGDCEISTLTNEIGNDHLTIPFVDGIFAGSNGLKINNEGKIDMDFTVPASKTILETKIGTISVKSNSKKYQLESSNNYEIAAVSSKHSSKPEQLEKIPDERKITINKGDEIGLEFSNNKTSTFELYVEGWGIVPELKTTGTVTINAPIIKVTKSNGEIVNSGDKLSPTDEITVNVSLNGNSNVDNPSAYLQKTTSTFQYGWEKIINGEQVELVEEPNSSQKCTIGYTLSEGTDTLLFPITPTNLFETMKIVNNAISFGPISVGNIPSSFSVQAKSGTHKILSDANYQINALSSIHSTGKNNSETNCLTISENETLKTFNSKSSAVSSFNFNLFDELWSSIPQIVRTGGVVSFGNPSISVKKSDGTPVSHNAVLDPSDTLDIEITLPQQSTISTPTAYYTPNVSANQLAYGWKLLQNGVETIGEPTDTCNIELKYTNTSDSHTISGTGAFSGLSTTTLTKTGVSVGTGGSLTISSKHGTYTISPEYNDCKIYALSSFGNTDNSHSQTPPTDTINGTAKTATFKYSVKAPQKELFYKIIQSSELGTTLQSANTYNPLTENNLINNLGFTKYTYGDIPVSITGGWCLIMTPLNLSEISAIDALGLDIAITNTNKNIGEYKVYYIQLDKTSTATLKIK